MHKLWNIPGTVPVLRVAPIAHRWLLGRVGIVLLLQIVGNFDVLCGRTGGIIPTRRRPESTDPERVVLGVADEEEQS